MMKGMKAFPFFRHLDRLKIPPKSVLILQMTTDSHSSTRHGSWWSVVRPMTLAVMVAALNLQAQTSDARDPFYTPPPSPAQVAAEAEAGRRMEIMNAMRRWGDEGMLPDKHLERRLEMIRTCPDMGKYLVSITDEMIERKYSDISDYLEAIAMRKDIPPEAIARYIGLTKRMIQDKTLNFSIHGFDGEYLTGMSDVLAAHPTPENEELLITLLGFNTNGQAFRALAQIGTIRALPAMQKYAEKLEQHARSHDDFYTLQRLKEVREGLAKLKARVSGVGRAGSG